ncbi:hypothetical protein HXZ91_04785 [Myroides odoratimimus]|uniref:hypothetical protein n=1 Tax=Myroides odoratimimus TaxID=76832 RepID=UPI002574D27A|nr:hypothetical protein [Myroides odoratimimus]MDM1033794.1 hypothetical protein [Myroides odoratimimus]
MSKYIVTFDPLSFTGKGSFIIKENDEIQKPVAMVLVPLSLKGDQKESEKLAKKQAIKIAEALEYFELIFD